MFEKKLCKRCGNEINGKYKFCPYCGNSLNGNRDWGMLGENYFTPSNNEVKFPSGLGMILNSLMKNLNKQFNELNKAPKTRNNKKPFIKQGISISIATSGNMPEIKINSFEKDSKQKSRPKEIPLKNFPQKILKKISGFPKQEPSTSIRRFGNKIIYEIDMPEVSSMKDISIIKLENSIEIKAIAKDKVYSKLIPINLPIIDYKFLKGKLILKFGVKN